MGKSAFKFVVVLMTVFIALPSFSQDRSGEMGEVGRVKDRGSQDVSVDGESVETTGGYDDSSEGSWFDEPASGESPLGVFMTEDEVNQFHELRTYMQSAPSGANQQIFELLQEGAPVLAIGASALVIAKLAATTAARFVVGAASLGLVSAYAHSEEISNESVIDSHTSFAFTRVDISTEQFVEEVESNGQVEELKVMMQEVSDEICSQPGEYESEEYCDKYK